MCGVSARTASSTTRSETARLTLLMVWQLYSVIWAVKLRRLAIENEVFGAFASEDSFFVVYTNYVFN